MDPGRYGLQQGWDNNSALEGYGAAVHEPNYRVGGSYDERRFVDERYLRDDPYPRNAYHDAPHGGPWPQTRRRSYEEEYPVGRGPRRHEKTYIDKYHDLDAFPDRDIGSYHELDEFRDGYSYRDHGYDRTARFGGRDRDDYAYDDYEYRSRIHPQNRENSRERDYEYGRHSYDSDYDRGGRRDGNWRRHESRELERERRTLSRERDQSPHRRHGQSRSRSRSRSRGWEDRPRSRSPRGWSHGRSHREDSYDSGRHERFDRRRDHEEKRYREQHSVEPSATVVVKGLSQKITEEDLYQILAEWGPLRHVRVIKERNSGISRGFAFIDFPSVDASRAMMDKIRDEGLLVDGRRLLFEYSSKPTGGPLGQDNAVRSGHSNYRNITVPCDWMCTICGCINFARRTSCFQCNEPRTDDAPPADMSSSHAAPFGKKGSEAGPTHVLVVRGLDENADEEMLRYEFSKHAPIKDLRLVRDKFTHVSRGFAFVHFYSVEDATKALEATNGTTLEKNGQILRVAYAKSIIGPGSGGPGTSQSSSLAAAAIEAATFSQQYDAYGWAPKEYNPDEKQSTEGQEQGAGAVAVQANGSAPQSGFVWDEASGYYYDAASGFYYDGNTGLYYDGNSGVWYSFDQQTQQYVPYSDQSENKPSSKSETSKMSDGSNSKKVVISAPAATITSADKSASLPDAVQAAATAAMAAEKKGKSKEIKLASKSSIVASKKKMSNVLTMWKQRSHEGQTTRVALDDNDSVASADDRSPSVGQLMKNKSKIDLMPSKDNAASSTGVAAHVVSSDSQVKPRPIGNSQGGTVMGVIRGSVKADTSYSALSAGVSTSSSVSTGTTFSSASAGASTVMTPFKTDSSALGSYPQAATPVPGKRRFSEAPKEQTQTTYRDRAAERRSLYGSSSAAGGDISDFELDRDPTFRKNSLDPMPFPPGVGGRGPVDANSNIQNYEVITADKAIDESNVGNRMLRNMGWQEGLGLGKDGSGMVEPVQANAAGNRAGLGSQPKKLDPSLEVQAGDSYKTVIQKKALARFREMS